MAFEVREDLEVDLGWEGEEGGFLGFRVRCKSRCGVDGNR